MRIAQTLRRSDRQTDFGALQRRMALDLIAGCLQTRRSESGAQPQFEMLGRRRPLHRQPWRHPRRPSFAPLSVMEIIRRYEASHGLN